ncbi:carbohydrate ABC transporter permease [Occultella gossypii]|uniref:Sugar ABC transporter permease n=1 Tax=Occultella gossypii TaxID=2800820 RepID=A0ABS7SCM1_9MICO|nr:sugar ABC transporter permease [Occultella gossypii]MBZ2198096.1 sugar ABC transporter permease [Occultella gossypii]
MPVSPATALPVESLVGPPAPVRGGSLSRRQGRVGWLFILPSMTGFLVFTLVPLIAGLGIAFTDWNVVSGLSGINLVGLDNFRGLLTDPMFWSSAGRTLFYAGLAVPGTMVGGLLLGLALNLDVPGRAVLRAVFFLPHIVTSIAIGMIWLLLLNPQNGVVNNALRTLGITEPPSWLVSESWSLPSLILIAIWSGVGYCAVIYLAGIQSLPQELYEAAMLDGAGVWRRFRTITWPSLMPTTTFLGVTLVISQSQGFGLINFLTAGGPGTSTTTLSYYMYQEGFQYYRFGYAAAIGVMSFLGVIVVSALLWRYQKGRGLYT